MITVTQNFGRLADVRLLHRADWQQAGLLARELIIRHTSAGKDEDGKAFTPYAESTRKQRARNRLSQRVTLQLSGQMLQNITVEPADDRVVLRFAR